jgi:hypothetical protein
MLALPCLLLAFAQTPAYYAVRFEELELPPGSVLPGYAGAPPWLNYGADVGELPWAVLAGEGEVRVRLADWDAMSDADSVETLGTLVARTNGARDLAGTLYLPKASGGGFLKLSFHVPAARATAQEKAFQAAEREQALRFLRLRVPGGAWFRHRYNAASAALGEPASTAAEVNSWNAVADFRDSAEALDLFSGGQALYENLQLERGLPASPDAAATVALDTLEGIGVKAIDWKPLLTNAETKLDPLAARVPADQHALFFASFPSFVATLDEANRLGSIGLSLLETRAADARTHQRYEHQLGLELSELARTFGPLVVESVALTGSDPYLRTGSDVALLLRAKAPEVVAGYVAARQEAAAGNHTTGKAGATAYRAVVDSTRSISSYLATLGDTVVVTNSLVQLERLVKVAEGSEPALGASDEYRFFRQRYVLGAEGESALLVLPDAAIRRWCSPRWRIAAARIARAAAELAEEHAAHLPELIAEVAPRDLGDDPAFPDLGGLHLTPAGIQSERYGTLEFLTPIAELPLAKVTEREAGLYKTWREGYQRAWSNFFDPIGARLSVGPERVALDLTVRPLILESVYADLRKMTGEHVLEAGSGDPHPEAVVQFVMALDPGWEPLKSIGSILGSTGEKLGVDLLSWLGGWVSVYVDQGEFWDELVQSEHPEELLENDPNTVPLALEVAVANPLKLALFMTTLRGFVDGTAPGMTVWKERVEGERRFVEITSPGLAENFSLYYATTPTALILSLHEPTLLAAMEREERHRAGEKSPPSFWAGAHAALELRDPGVQVLASLFESEFGQRERRDSWRNLPILNEWHRLHPELDPVALHERLFGERLLCPGGGSYVWNEDWHTLESSVFGHPGEPKGEHVRPSAWDEFGVARFALGFELDGLRVRAELERK